MFQGNHRMIPESSVRVPELAWWGFWLFWRLQISLDLFTHSQIKLIHRLHKHHQLESSPTTMALVLSACITLAVSFTLLSALASHQFGMYKLMDIKSRHCWNGQDQGYVWHVVGNVTEWALFGCCSMLFGCLSRRMMLFSQTYGSGRDGMGKGKSWKVNKELLFPILESLWKILIELHWATMQTGRVLSEGNSRIFFNVL